MTESVPVGFEHRMQHRLGGPGKNEHHLAKALHPSPRRLDQIDPAALRAERAKAR